jgi:hypothetical protein
MVKVAFYRCNIFLSQNTPAYLELDTKGVTVRLKVYEGAVTYIDDTATGTNRTGYQVIQIWSTNPFPLHPSPLGRMVIVEVYDTSNNFIEKHRLPYLYGQKYRSIPIVDENGNPLTCDVAVTVYPFYYCMYSGSYVDIPWSSEAEDRQIYEVYNTVNKKYYFIGMVNAIESLSQLQLYPVKKVRVRVDYDASVIPLSNLLSLGGSLPYVKDFINNFYSLVLSNTVWLARAISSVTGIDLPIAGVEYHSETNTISVYYEQDPIPLVVKIILFALGVGAVIALITNLPTTLDIIKNVVITEQVRAQAEIIKTMAEQNKAILNAALQQCGSNVECIRQVLAALNTANVSMAQAAGEINSLKEEISKLREQRLLIGLGAGLGGIVAGYLFSRPQIVTRIVERV